MPDPFTPLTIMPVTIVEIISGLGAFTVNSLLMLGNILCKLCFFLPDVSLLVSVESLLLISLDRFVAVVFALKAKLISSKTHLICILCTWIIATAVHAPYFYTFRLFPKGDEYYCEYDWGPAFDHDETSNRQLVSVESLLLISLDRFVAVVFALKAKLISSKTHLICILCTWIIATAVHAPYFYTFRLFPKGDEYYCEYDWGPAFDHDETSNRQLVSVESLLLISLDRFVAVVFALKAKLISSKTHLICILCTWIIATAVHAPYFYTFRLFPKGDEYYCEYDWGPAFDRDETSNRYVTATFLAIIAVPICILIIVYGGIAITLKCSHSQRKEISVSARSRGCQKSMHIIGLSVAIVTAFIFCMVPYLVVMFCTIFLWNWEDPPICAFRTVIPFVAQFLVPSWSAVNPCICFIFCKNYRRSLKQILSSAVQIYEFHIFIISSSSFPGILRTNLMTSSQLAC